jgi:hypothetical protein
MGSDLSIITSDEIANYVSSYGEPYKKYKQRIIDNSIDGSTLLLLSDDDIIEALKELDISVIHSAKLRSELNKYKSNKLNDHVNDNVNDNVFNEYLKTYSSSSNSNNIQLQQEDKVPIIKLRDFTIVQLKEFNGNDNKPIYISLRGDVFDVTIAKELYGEGTGIMIIVLIKLIILLLLIRLSLLCWKRCI